MLVINGSVETHFSSFIAYEREPASFWRAMNAILLFGALLPDFRCDILPFSKNYFRNGAWFL